MRSSVDTACSGSSEEIKIGAGVLDYISELGNIQAKILAWSSIIWESLRN